MSSLQKLSWPNSGSLLTQNGVWPQLTLIRVTLTSVFSECKGLRALRLWCAIIFCAHLEWISWIRPCVVFLFWNRSTPPKVCSFYWLKKPSPSNDELKKKRASTRLSKSFWWRWQTKCVKGKRKVSWNIPNQSMTIMFTQVEEWLILSSPKCQWWIPGGGGRNKRAPL